MVRVVVDMKGVFSSIDFLVILSGMKPELTDIGLLKILRKFTNFSAKPVASTIFPVCLQANS